MILPSFTNLNNYAQSYNDLCKIVFVKESFIKKLPNGKYRVLSQRGKNLGTYDSKEQAEKRLKQIEMFKHIKKSSEELSYSSIMRQLVKSHSQDVIDNFQKEFKKNFDDAVLSNEEDPEKIALNQAIKVIDDSKVLNKSASAINLGDPRFAGEYLSNLIKFIMRRISTERRPKSINSLKKKIYYLNEYDIASKKVPASSALGTAITLLKHLLLEHNPKYIRAVLNSIVSHL